MTSFSIPSKVKSAAWHGGLNRDLFDQKSKGIIIPYRWVTAIGDIIIMRHLTRNAKTERKDV
jgi:sporulation protein YlmC with PRC-barrel domain